MLVEKSLSSKHLKAARLAFCQEFRTESQECQGEGGRKKTPIVSGISIIKGWDTKTSFQHFLTLFRFSPIHLSLFPAKFIPSE